MGDVKLRLWKVCERNFEDVDVNVGLSKLGKPKVEDWCIPHFGGVDPR